MSEPRRLEIRPDHQGIEWTHLHGLIGAVITLQDLPATLSSKVTPFVRTLLERNVVYFQYELERLPDVVVDREVVNIAQYARNPVHIIDILELISWWMEYRRVRWMCRANCQGKVSHPTWRCPDCHVDVPREQERCPDPQCASWNKLHLATGEPRFRPTITRNISATTQA